MRISNRLYALFIAASHSLNYLDQKKQRITAENEAFHSKFRGLISEIILKENQVVGGLLSFSGSHGFGQQKNVSGVQIENLTYLGKQLTDNESAKISQQNTKDLVIIR